MSLLRRSRLPRSLCFVAEISQLREPVSANRPQGIFGLVEIGIAQSFANIGSVASPMEKWTEFED